MKIACFTISYNEELMLPHFIKHYKQFCDKIVVFDNMSTDSTEKIALDSGCDVIKWKTEENDLNDSAYLEIKSNCYKSATGEYDWVIVVDTDEFISHKRGDSFVRVELERMKQLNIQLPDVEGYNMFSWDHDLTEDLSSINYAVPEKLYSKLCVFNPSLNMSWDPGCHRCHLATDYKDSGLILKHYKFINYDNLVSRSSLLASRLSEVNKRNKWGSHYLNSEEQWKHFYEDLEKRKILLF